MDIILKKIIKNYIKIFKLRPKILSTIIFIPFLYLIGWIFANPIFLLGFNKENISLIGTIFTFLIFLISLPKWFEVRWGTSDAWGTIGIRKNKGNRVLISYFLKGFAYSIILISIILIAIIFIEWGSYLGRISSNIFFNSVILIIGIGFAEELIFRGWLLEEFRNQFGLKKAIIFQAFIFSIVHIGFDMPFRQMLSILTGLFLLGILLALIKVKDNNYLWGCIGMHGGLVGGWFITTNGLVEISSGAPAWLVGPGSINPNPLGGLIGIILLSGLCIFYFLNLRKKNLKSY